MSDTTRVDQWPNRKGWQSLAFDMPELANGVWYYGIRARNGGASKLGKLMILR